MGSPAPNRLATSFLKGQDHLLFVNALFCRGTLDTDDTECTAWCKRLEGRQARFAEPVFTVLAVSAIALCSMLWCDTRRANKTCIGQSVDV